MMLVFSNYSSIKITAPNNGTKPYDCSGLGVVRRNIVLIQWYRLELSRTGSSDKSGYSVLTSRFRIRTDSRYRVA